MREASRKEAFASWNDVKFGINFRGSAKMGSFRVITLSRIRSSSETLQGLKGSSTLN